MIQRIHFITSDDDDPVMFFFCLLKIILCLLSVEYWMSYRSGGVNDLNDFLTFFFNFCQIEKYKIK